MKREVSRYSFEKYFVSDFKEDRPVGGELVHADRRTDMTKLIVALRNFSNEPKNSSRRCTIAVLQYKQRNLPEPSVFFIRSLGTFRRSPPGREYQRLLFFTKALLLKILYSGTIFIFFTPFVGESKSQISPAAQMYACSVQEETTFHCMTCQNLRRAQ